MTTFENLPFRTRHWNDSGGHYMAVIDDSYLTQIVQGEEPVVWKLEPITLSASIIEELLKEHGVLTDDGLFAIIYSLDELSESAISEIESYREDYNLLIIDGDKVFLSNL